MTTNYDPLALPSAYFEGLPAVPNSLPVQPGPVEVPEQCACPCQHCTSFEHRPYECSLKKGGRDDWWAVGDSARHDRLTTLHGGTAPEVLCSTCFLPMVGTLNRTALSRAG